MSAKIDEQGKINAIIVRFNIFIILFVSSVLLGSGCSVVPTPPQDNSSPTTANSSSQTQTIDPHAIPIGDAKLSIEPKQGYVYSCVTQFNGRGASHVGPWINGDTWDMTTKAVVMGNVLWPDAIFSTSVAGSERLLAGNGLPVDTATGIFPIQTDDPAYQYDRNPNPINAYGVSYRIPTDPQIAATASCVPMGIIGFALDGVAIFNALDAAGNDGGAHEVQDACAGHPEHGGRYHYHTPSPCMPHADENNALVGYALDGFGIFSRFDANGREYTNADLDECHGITSEIAWDGKTVSMYHYVLTREYPYTIGCFRGTPTVSN